jgi:ferric iron reductase protein FhuF
MEPAQIADVITRLGYPIVVSLILMWYIYRVTNPLITTIIEMNEKLDTVLQKIITLCDDIHDRSSGQKGA